MKLIAITMLALITIGLVVGVSFVTSPKLTQTTTEAAVPPELTTITNQDVSVEFTRLSPHNRWDYMLSGALCFTNNPPSNGKWKVSVYHDGLLTPEIAIGGSVQKTVTNPASARCNGGPSLLFNVPINMPARTRLPAGADCLPAGDLKVRVDTSARNPWMIQPEVATISRSYFCPDPPAPTNDPNQTPTPAAAANATVNLQLSGTWKAGFNEFQTTAMMCNFATDGSVDWESCGAQGNKTSNTDITRKGSDSTINKTINLSVNQTPGGTKALVIFYDYKLENGKADNSGIRVEEVAPTHCESPHIDFGAFVCGVHVPAAGLTSTFKLMLPTATATTYELRLGKEESEARTIMDPCTHTIDSSNKEGSESDTERGRCSSTAADNKIKVTYYNAGTAEEKLYWLLGRCNGTYDENEGICEVNAPVETTELVQNFFETENFITLAAGQVLVCTFDKSKYPITENEANVHTSGAISCVSAAPTPTPLATATPIPTNTPAVAATATPIPNAPTATPTPPGSHSGAGYTTSISFYNNSSKAVTSVTTVTCHGPNNTICTSELTNTSIQPRQRGVVESDLVLPQGVEQYSVKCRATFEGSTTPVNCPNEVTSPLMQNILYKIVASEAGGITGFGSTEIDACDVNSDACCNANDFSIVATKYADEIAPTEQSRSDINGDGIINGFDLVFTQSNFGKGLRCSLNLAPELNPVLNPGSN